MAARTPARGPFARGPFTRGLDLVVAGAEWLAVALLVAMTAVVSLAVFYRYVLNRPLGWYDEVASFLLVWLTFVGAVVVTRRRRHIGFELVVERSRPPVRRALEVLSELLVLAFEALIVVYGWNLVARMGDETAVSLLWLEMGWVYAIMPATAALMALVTLERLAALLSGAPPDHPGPAPARDATE
jgi:TRAP-type C4-dicarboxylate transport system permease small subunit